MFRIIGAVVVYGFALYGLVESLAWLTTELDHAATARK